MLDHILLGGLFVALIVLAGLWFTEPVSSPNTTTGIAVDLKLPSVDLARKQRSEAVLTSSSIPTCSWLPVPVLENEVTLRNKDEVARRALCLLLVAAKGEGAPPETLTKIESRYQLANYLSPKEMAFMASTLPSEHDRTQFVWRYEAAWVLLWALGFFNALEKPTAPCDVPQMVLLARDRSPEKFLSDSRLRSTNEVLDQADLALRYHWAAVDARLKGARPPGGINPSVVFERHYALNWLIRLGDEDWDDVPTDPVLFITGSIVDNFRAHALHVDLRQWAVASRA